MINEARKLQVIEEVLKIDNDAILTEVEALLKGTHTTGDKLSKKYRGALKLTDKQRQDLQRHL